MQIIAMSRLYSSKKIPVLKYYEYYMFAKVMGSQSEPFQLVVCDVNVTCDQSRDLRADHVISFIFSINKHNPC